MRATPLPPALVLMVGALLATVGVRAQRSLQVRMPLADAVPRAVEGFQGRDLVLPKEEIDAAGVTTYLSRVFELDSGTAGMQRVFLYVGYYDRQTSGKTIHSPKNCLPGAGWEALTSTVAQVTTPSGVVTVNRYLIQKGGDRDLVLYWYQGRGRVESNEYMVKWDLMRDAALQHRSEEALVRIIVPLRTNEADALELATRVAGRIVPSLGPALPI